MVTGRLIYANVAAAVLSAACASPVSAAVLAENGYADDDGWTLQGYSYTAAARERNVLSVARSEETIVFADPGAAISIRTPHAACAQQSTSQLACPMAADTLDLAISLGDHDDRATIDLRDARVYVELGMTGGRGKDRLAVRSRPSSFNVIKGDTGDDRLSGGDGQDALHGGVGADQLSGGRGRDILDGGQGTDDLQGGTGTDSVQYSVKSTVSVTLDGRANDGVAGERDWVHADIENASIQRGTVVGNSQKNDLGVGSGIARGGAGADSLSGRRGSSLYGDTGNDIVDGDHALGYGGLGNDEMRGSMVAYGGPGKDQMHARGGRHDGGADNDVIEKSHDATGAALIGGSGNDTIDGRDEGDCEIPVEVEECTPAAVKDQVSCGPGRDTVIVGKADIVASDCERITRER